MKKTIREYLPKQVELTPFTVKIPKDLFEEIQAIREKENLTWTDLITACLRQFADEFNGKKRSA